MKDRARPDYITSPHLNRRTYLLSVPHTGTRTLYRFLQLTKTRYADLHFPIPHNFKFVKKAVYVIPIRDPIEVVYSYERRRVCSPYRGKQDSISYNFVRNFAGYWEWLQSLSEHDRNNYVNHIPVDRTTLLLQRQEKQYDELPDLRDAIDRQDAAALFELAPVYLAALRTNLAQPAAFWGGIGRYDLWYL